MALANGLRIVWLDQHIGQEGNCEHLKSNFREAMAAAAAMPPDSIDVLIWTLDTNAAPFEFAHTPEQAIALIQRHHDKQIIFISSASLGQDIIPTIVSNHTHVYKFYIFCAQMHYVVDWACAYIDCLQMFDFELDLLLRLARDISLDIIKQGKIYMDLDDPTNALKCFEHSQTIEEEANARDKNNPPFLLQLRMLKGHENQIGLIQQASEKKKQQDGNKRSSS